jgi:hypothetical protein
MTLLHGASGYFSSPQLILDPNLFDGTSLLPHVRQTLLDLFYNHMDTMFSNPRSWSMLWLAGSGISYQWSGDRGNGDLDVLFGLDYTKFVSDNPTYGYYSREEIAQSMDDMLKRHLWPKTAHTEFGNFVYEVTYYLNPGTEDYDKSITNIHPYAAYNLTEDKWTVEPVKPEEFNTNYPAEFEAQATENRHTAERLANRYKYLTQQLSTVHPNTPLGHNLTASKTLLLQHIRTMFDTLHLGRKNAFSSMGEGYGDFYNYQWQSAKRDGIVATFNEILNQEN